MRVEVVGGLVKHRRKTTANDNGSVGNDEISVPALMSAAA